MLKRLRPKSRTGTVGRFLEAAHAGNRDRVSDFIRKGIDVNATNEIGVTGLHLAAKEGHLDVVSELVKHGARVDAATRKGVTALHVASLSGKVDVIRLLLENGAKINIQSKDGFTPLYMAAQENHAETVRCLLSSGASQSLTTEDGFTALSVALQQGHDDVANILLGHGTSSKLKLPQVHIATKKGDLRAVALLLKRDEDNINTTSKSGFTPLHIAAHYGNTDIGRLLIGKGADVNFRAKNGISPLHVASKRGRSSLVSLLIDSGADVNNQTRDGISPLHCAVINGGSKVVGCLLQKGASFDAKTRIGFSALHLAVQGDHINCIKQLLSHGAPINDVSEEQLTPLHIAAHCGNVRSVRLLLEKKCEINPTAVNGFTPLHIAAKRNHKEIVELLIKHGAKVDARTPTGLTPLHVASFMGHSGVVSSLLRLGSNPDFTTTTSGDTALHFATRNQHLEVIDQLLHSGSQVDSRDADQVTPLHIAVQNGDFESAALLLHHGATPSAKTSDLNTPLHLTAAGSGKDDLTQLLLEHGASPASANKKGFLPLHVAAKHGNVRVARLLLARSGTDPNVSCDNDLTPLHVAVHYNQINTALLLLEKGARPNCQAKNGYTALHVAAAENRMNLVPYLLEHGANINAESETCFNPLHLSSKAGHLAMTTLLLERGAGVDRASKDGLTPLHLAALGNRVSVAEVLLQFGANINAEANSGLRPIHLASQLQHAAIVEFLLARYAEISRVSPNDQVSISSSAEQLSTDSAVDLQAVSSDIQAGPFLSTQQSDEERLRILNEDDGFNANPLLNEKAFLSKATSSAYKIPDEVSDLFAFDLVPDPGCYEGRQSLPSPCSLIRREFVYTREDRGQSLAPEDRHQHNRQPATPSEESQQKPPQESSTLESAAEPSSTDSDNLPSCKQSRLPPPDVSRLPSTAAPTSSFLISFLVDARGGAMQGSRCAGVRVIVPPDTVCMPTCITCRYVRKEKLLQFPALSDGEGLATRVLEMGPDGIVFSGPVVIEVSHFASLQDGKREVIALRSDNGQKWFEHTAPVIDGAAIESLCGASDESIQKVKIVTHTFPRYFALISRFHHESATIGPEGGTLSSKALPDVRAIFPPESIKRSTKVQLQVNPVDGDLVAKVFGSEVHRSSPVVTIDPRHRRFHQPIALTIPLPKSMNDSTEIKRSNLRVFSSRSEGIMPPVWEDITDAIAMTILNGSATLLVTVSARFWLIDSTGKEVSSSEVTELYQETLAIPFWSKFLVFAKRLDENESRIRLFSLTDNQLDKTLDNQESFTEVARSNDVVVFDGKPIQVEVTGNLLPHFEKPSQTLSINFHAFRENRLPFSVKMRSPEDDPVGQVSLNYKPKSAPGGASEQTVVCVLGVRVPDLTSTGVEEQEKAISANALKSDAQISKAELHLTDIADILDADWLPLAVQLGLTQDEVSEIQADYDYLPEQALIMLHQWVVKNGGKATGNSLERALKQIGRADVIAACMHNISEVTDDRERVVAKNYIKDSDSRDELTLPRFRGNSSSRDSSSRHRRASSDVSYGDISSLPESRSFCYDTGSEIDSETEKDEYRKTPFDDRSDDHCFYVDGSINSSAYANIRSTESEDSDAVLSDGASDVEMGNSRDQKDGWDHPHWKDVVLRRNKDEARVMADATVRLSQVSDATMTPEDVEESDRELTPCVQDMASSSDTRDNRGQTSFSNEDHHNQGNVLKTPEAIKPMRAMRDKAANCTRDDHNDSGTRDAERESSEVVLQVKEGDLFLSTDISNLEELLGDGTRVKRRTITRKQMRPVEETLVKGNEILETRTKEEVVRIEVEEDITELEPGVEDEFGAHVDCETTSEEFEEMLEDGVVIQRKVTRVRVRRNASTSSLSDWESESSVGKSLESVNDSKTSGDAEEKLLIRHEERKSLNDCLISPIPSESMVTPLIQALGPEKEANSTPKDGVVHRFVGEVFQETEEDNEEGVSENGIKICRKITTTRHILPVTEIIRNIRGNAVSKTFEIIGTEIEEEILESALDTDFDLENGESETSVEESEETMPDGTWIKKKTTWMTVTPRNSHMFSDAGVNGVNTELNQKPLLNSDVMSKSRKQASHSSTAETLNTELDKLLYDEPETQTDMHQHSAEGVLINEESFAAYKNYNDSNRITGRQTSESVREMETFAPSGDDVLNKKTDNRPSDDDFINTNDRNSDSDVVMKKVDQNRAMELSFNETDRNTLLDSEDLITYADQELSLDPDLIAADDRKIDLINEINRIEIDHRERLESEGLVTDHRLETEEATEERDGKGGMESERPTKEIDEKGVFDAMQSIKTSYQWQADDAECLIKDNDQNQNGIENKIKETEYEPAYVEDRIKEIEQKPAYVECQFEETEQKPAYVESQIMNTEQRPAYVESQFEETEQKPAYVESQFEETEQKPAYVESQIIETEQKPAYVESQIKETEQKPTDVESQLKENEQKPTYVESQLKENEQKPTYVESQPAFVESLLKEAEQKLAYVESQPAVVQTQLTETDQNSAGAEELMNAIDRKTFVRAEVSVEESNLYKTSDTKEFIEETDKKPSLDRTVTISETDQTILSEKSSKGEQKLLIEGATIENSHQPPLITEESIAEGEQASALVKHPCTDSIITFKASEKTQGSQILQGPEPLQMSAVNVELHRKSDTPVSINVPRETDSELDYPGSEHLLEATTELTPFPEMVWSPTEFSQCASTLNREDDVEQRQQKGGELSENFYNDKQQVEAELWREVDSDPENQRAAFSSETFNDRAISTQNETPSYISGKMIESKIFEMLNQGRFKHLGFGPNAPHSEQTVSASGDDESVDGTGLIGSSWTTTESVHSGGYVKAVEAELRAEEDDFSKALSREYTHEEGFSGVLPEESMPVHAALSNEESDLHRDLVASSAIGDFNMEPSEKVLEIEYGRDNSLEALTLERNVLNSLDAGQEHEYCDVQGELNQIPLDASMNFMEQDGVANDSAVEENSVFENWSQAETELVRDEISKRLESAFVNDFTQESFVGTDQGLESFKNLHLDSSQPSEVSETHGYQFEPSGFVRGDGYDAEVSQLAVENGFQEDCLNVVPSEICAEYGFQSEPLESGAHFGLNEEPLGSDSFMEDLGISSGPYGSYAEPQELDEVPLRPDLFTEEPWWNSRQYGSQREPSELTGTEVDILNDESQMTTAIDSNSHPLVARHLSSESSDILAKYRFLSRPSEAPAGYGVDSDSEVSARQFGSPSYISSRDDGPQDQPLRMSEWQQDDNEAKAGICEEPQTPTSATRRSGRINFSRPERRLRKASQEGSAEGLPMPPSPVALQREDLYSSPSSTTIRGEFRSSYLPAEQDQFSSSGKSDVRSPVASDVEGDVVYESTSQSQNEFKPPFVRRGRGYCSPLRFDKETAPLTSSSTRSIVTPDSSPTRDIVSRVSSAPISTVRQDSFSPISFARDALPPLPTMHDSPLHSDVSSSALMKHDFPWSTASPARQSIHSPERKEPRVPASSVRRDVRSVTSPGRQGIRSRTSPMRQDIHSPTSHAWQEGYSPFSSLRRDTVSPASRVLASPMTEDDAYIASSRRYRSPTPPTGRDFSFRSRMRRPSRESLSDVPLSLPKSTSAESSLYTPTSPFQDSCTSPPIRHDVYSPLHTTRFFESALDSPTPLAEPDGQPRLTRRPSLLQSTLEAHSRYLDAITKIEEIVPGLMPNPALMGPDVTQETIKGKIRCSTSDHEEPKVETDDRTIMKKSTMIQYTQPVICNYYRNGILIDTKNSEVILGKYVDDFVYDTPTDLTSVSDPNGDTTTSVDVSEETLADGTWLKHKTTRVVVGPKEELEGSEGKSSTQDFPKTTLTASDLMPLLSHHPVLIPEIISRLGLQPVDSGPKKSQKALSGKELVAFLLAERRKKENATAESKEPGVLSLDSESHRSQGDEFIQGDVVTIDVPWEADRIERFTEPVMTESVNTISMEAANSELSAPIQRNITTEEVNGSCSVSTVQSAHNVKSVFLPPLSIMPKVDAHHFFKDGGKQPVTYAITPTQLDQRSVERTLSETEITPAEAKEDYSPVASGIIPSTEAPTQLIESLLEPSALPPTSQEILSEAADRLSVQSGVNSETIGETIGESDWSPSTSSNTLQERGGEPDRKIVKTTVKKSVKRKVRKVHRGGNVVGDVVTLETPDSSADISPSSESDVLGSSLFLSAIPASDISLPANSNCIPPVEAETEQTTTIEESLTEDILRKVKDSRLGNDEVALTRNPEEPEFHSNMPELALEQSVETFERSEELAVDVSVAKTQTREEPPSNGVSVVADSSASNEVKDEDGSSGTEV